jgi:type II secretory pathway pseudopilin PulG
MFKNESGFSLVELAIAAAIAVALGAIAVTALSGTTSSVVAKGTQYGSDAQSVYDDALATH